MKRLFRTPSTKLIFTVCLFSVAMVSCKKDSTTTATPGTITAQVSAGANFTLLKSAVVKAVLATTLDGAGPFTVFAPTDDAFIASGITSTTIGNLSADQLKTILLYHTLGSKILAANVPAGPNAKVVTVGGDSVFVTKNSIFNISIK